MAVQCWENEALRELRNDGTRRQYSIKGTRDEGEARAALLDTAPEIVDRFIAQTFDILHMGDDVWEAVMEWGTRGYRELGEIRVDFDTTGGTTHLSQSLFTVGSYTADGSAAPNHGGAINYDGKTVKGVNIVIPSLKLTLSTRTAMANLSWAYIAQLAMFTGRMNAGRWQAFGAGEVLFLGARGSYEEHLTLDPDAEPETDLAFQLEVQPTVYGLPVGDITIPAKLGHDYLWVRYQTAEDSNANALVQTPSAAYIERVYRFGFFGAIGL